MRVPSDVPDLPLPAALVQRPSTPPPLPRPLPATLPQPRKAWSARTTRTRSEPLQWQHPLSARPATVGTIRPLALPFADEFALKKFSAAELAAKHVKRTATKRESLSDTLDRSIGETPSAAPAPLEQKAASGKTPKDKRQQAIEALRAGQKGSGAAAAWHIRKHVLEIYESYVVGRSIEHERTASNQSRPRVRPPDPGSFADVLKLYYPTFSKPTIDSMIEGAKDGIDLIDRRQWVARTKGTFAERLQLAFNNSDKDRSGGLSLSEFLVAVKETGAHPPGASACGKEGTTEQQLQEMFASADVDGDGVLDFDEFLELCSSQPWLVAAFDRIVELGVRRKLRSEEARLMTIFRHPVSPISRLVKTPGGHRFRPSLYDLRPAHEVGQIQRRAERAS